MTDILIVGDTHGSPELRHEIPVEIIDTFLYAEVGGRRVTIVWSIEGDRIAVVDPSLEIIASETFPMDDLIRAGVDYYELAPTNTVRMVESLGLTKAHVPRAFPLQHADALRAAGVELIPGQRLFDLRRRRKTDFELDGIRRASRVAEAGMSAIASLLARSKPSDGGRTVDGEPLTCELLREAATAEFEPGLYRGTPSAVSASRTSSSSPRTGPRRSRATPTS